MIVSKMTQGDLEFRAQVLVLNSQTGHAHPCPLHTRSHSNLGGGISPGRSRRCSWFSPNGSLSLMIFMVNKTECELIAQRLGDLPLHPNSFRSPKTLSYMK